MRFTIKSKHDMRTTRRANWYMTKFLWHNEKYGCVFCTLLWGHSGLHSYVASLQGRPNSEHALKSRVGLGVRTFDIFLCPLPIVSISFTVLIELLLLLLLRHLCVSQVLTRRTSRNPGDWDWIPILFARTKMAAETLIGWIYTVSFKNARFTDYYAAEGLV